MKEQIERLFSDKPWDGGYYIKGYQYGGEWMMFDEDGELNRHEWWSCREKSTKPRMWADFLTTPSAKRKYKV